MVLFGALGCNGMQFPWREYLGEQSPQENCFVLFCLDSSFGINFTHDFNFLVLGSLYGWSTGIGRVSYPHVVDMDIFHFSLIKEAITNTPLENSEVIRGNSYMYASMYGIPL